MNFTTPRRLLMLLSGLCLGLGCPSLLLGLVLGSEGARYAFAIAQSAATPEPYSVNVPVLLLASPSVSLEGGVISVQKPEAPRRANPVTNAVSSGRGNFHLSGAAFTIDESPRAEPVTVVNSQSEITPLLSALLLANFQSVSIDRAGIVLREANGASRRLGQLSATIERTSKTMLNASGAFERNGETITFDVNFAHPSSRKASSPLPLTATLRSDLFDLNITGSIVRGAEPKIVSNRTQLSVKNIKKMVSWLGAPEIRTPGLNTFDAEGQMEWAGRSVDFENAKFVIDDNTATGRLAFSFRGSRPEIDATLDFSLFEAGPYIVPSDSRDGVQNERGWIPRLISGLRDRPSGELLRQFNADIRVSANAVMIRGAPIGRGAAAVSLKDARAHISLSDVQLADGGEGEARILIDVVREIPSFDLDGELRSGDLAALSQAVVGKPGVGGTGTVEVDLTMKGNTTDELVSSLSGRLRANAWGPSSIGLRISDLLMPVGAASRQSWQEALKGRTQAQSLTLNVSAKSGQITTETVEMVSGDERVMAAGTVDVSRQILDLELTRMMRSGAEKPAEAPVTNSVRIRGPWLAPSIEAAGAGGRS